jgi:hypothetical protein
VKAVACSPDFEGIRQLRALRLPDGRLKVVLPAELLSGYTLVRILR